MAEWFAALNELLFASADAPALEWVIKVFVLVALVVTAGFLLKFAAKLLIRQADKTLTEWDDVLLKSLRQPLTLLVWVVGLTYAAEFAWETGEQGELIELASNVRALGVIFCLVMFIWRFLNLGEEVFMRRRETRGEAVDRAGVRAVNKILKASVAITGVLMVLNTMGYSISGVLAFGGIGGIAIGFAAKDLLSNFFGGLMIYLDRPFAEGDWIRSPDREIEGTVEHIGWRQTRIRSFARYPVYVPNSIFTQIAIENPSRMANRRIYETIGVRYDDVAKVNDIVADIKAMLQAHPDVDTDQIIIVNLNAFSESSVDIMLYAFTKTTEWRAFHEVKQDVMLKAAEAIERRGGEIAYPTRTLHLSENADAQKARKSVDSLRAAP